jgi:hypothetical protein
MEHIIKPVGSAWTADLADEVQTGGWSRDRPGGAEISTVGMGGTSVCGLVRQRSGRAGVRYPEGGRPQVGAAAVSTGGRAMAAKEGRSKATVSSSSGRARVCVEGAAVAGFGDGHPADVRSQDVTLGWEDSEGAQGG